MSTREKTCQKNEPYNNVNDFVSIIVFGFGRYDYICRMVRRMKTEKLEMCLWKCISFDDNSTTFRNSSDETNPLYRCKYVCDGYNQKCRTYERQYNVLEK